MERNEGCYPQQPDPRRYYRVERKFNGIRTTVDTVRSLIRAHS